jgi:hypothetical protein
MMYGGPGTNQRICTRFLRIYARWFVNKTGIMIKPMMYNNAQTVRRFLVDSGGSCSLCRIKEGLKIDDQDLNRAIGWLAKEQSIFINRVSDDLVITLEFD